MGRGCALGAEQITPARVPIQQASALQLRVDVMGQDGERRSAWSWWYLLFIIQFVAVLWPPFYNKLEPTLWGVPFFYWYQLAWVIIGAVLTAIVYFATDD